MRIQKLRIRNFRAIKNMVLDNLENALILVGKNSTGKQPYWKLSAGFWMIRDGDGKNADELRHRLCRYYEERKKLKYIFGDITCLIYFMIRINPGNRKF